MKALQTEHREEVPKVKNVDFVIGLRLQRYMRVFLDDGRILDVPLADFATLDEASPGQLRNWELIAGGTGIHWEDIDEDLSVAGLVKDYATAGRA